MYKMYIHITDKIDVKLREQLIEQMDKTQEIFQQAQSINIKTLSLKLPPNSVQCECNIEQN